MSKSRSIIAFSLIIVILVAAFAVYAGWTYPRTVLTIPVSFTLGANVTNTKFDQLALDSKVQVTVSVETGTSLWRARILNGDQIIWEHTATQTEQTSYNSGRIDLPSGPYNFTFGTIGGALNAKVAVASKGGFW
jgi:hypothetical protein